MSQHTQTLASDALGGRPPSGPAAERTIEYLTGQFARLANCVQNVYHTPSDEWQPAWDWTGAVRDVKLLHDIGRRVADTTHWPEWYEGNPFKAVRERSSEARAPRTDGTGE